MRFTRRSMIVGVGLAAAMPLAGCGTHTQGHAAPASRALASSSATSGSSGASNSTNAGQPGAYVDYATYLKDRAAYTGRRVALFFWASWCPICQGDDDYIRGTVASRQFPQDLTIVKVNYDVETQLEQKYGVTSQATFVPIDATGKALSPPVVPETVLDILNLP
jgi:thioredoxin 1